MWIRTAWGPRARVVLGMTLLIGGCKSASPEPSPAEPAPVEPAPVKPAHAEPASSAQGTSPSAPAKHFGAAFTDAPPLPFGKLLAFPEEHAGHAVTVEGVVRRNCTKKGCWMELAVDTTPNAASCRVTFQDYSFFVPLDSAGSRARVQGQVLVRELDKAQVDHLEAEGAHFSDKSEQGTAQEVRIVATGVELWRG